MPRTQKENDRIRQATKENIRSAAIEIFIEKGYHDAAIDDIANRAGVSKGLIYNHYKGKEDLLAEMVKTRIEDINHVMQTAATLDAPSEQLTHIIEGALNNVKQNPKLYKFYLNLQTQPEEDKVLARYSQMLNEAMSEQFEVQCEMFAKLEGKDERMRSLYFSSTLHGAMLMISTYPDRFPVRDIKEKIVQQFCVV